MGQAYHVRGKKLREKWPIHSSTDSTQGVVYTFFMVTDPRRIEKLRLSSTKFYDKRMIAMNPYIESTIYIDPQTQVPADFCPVCGRERYLPGLHCIRCEGGMV